MTFKQNNSYKSPILDDLLHIDEIFLRVNTKNKRERHLGVVAQTKF